MALKDMLTVIADNHIKVLWCILCRKLNTRNVLVYTVWRWAYILTKVSITNRIANVYKYGLVQVVLNHLWVLTISSIHFIV